MSEPDINTIVARLSKKLFWVLVVPILVIIISAKAIDIRTQNKRAEGYYIELFRLTAELSTTQAMYMQANDKEIVRKLESVEIELRNLYDLNVGQSNWNTRVGTILEIQTGIQVNP